MEETPDTSNQLHDYKFESPLEFICYCDDLIQSGEVNLHKWQIEQLEELGRVRPTAQLPYILALVAANGSGKDKYIISVFCLWFILTRLNATCIVTSSSAQQLDKQTERYIARLAQAFNAKQGAEVLDVVKRHIRCPVTGGEIILFATDEAGKAEGYHPVDAKAELAIVCNEAKSIPEEIFQALSRCSGYSYWLEVSTPGAPEGHFYQQCKDTTGSVTFRRVTSYDCAHISNEEIERDAVKYGRGSSLFRSKHLAIFTSLDQQVVITREMIDKWIVAKLEPVKVGQPKRAGLDFGAGRDESCFSVWQGNEQIGQEFFVCEDTELTVRRCIDWINKYEVKSEDVYCDDGGVGRAMAFSIIEKGYQINRVLFQWAAINKKDFMNRGAELWWKFARMYELGLLIILPDQKLIEQLSSRKYVQPAGGRIRLMEKQQLRAEGYPSPDRADAAILAHTATSLEYLMSLGKSGEEQPANRPIIAHNRIPTPKEVDKYSERKWSALNPVLANSKSFGQQSNPALTLRKVLKYGIPTTY